MIPGTGVHAGQTTLAWDASPSSQVGGYKLDYGQEAGHYTASVDVGATTSYTVNNLTDGSTYYFAVKAYDTNRTIESLYSNEINTTLPAIIPTVNFSVSSTEGNAPLNIVFTPTVTGTIQSWEWDFGDGTRNSGSGSTIPTAVKSYSIAGSYSARLTVTYSGGNVVNSQTIKINPLAQFSASATTGMAPFSVSMTDTSTGTPTAWSWDFGDNTTSTVQNPSHIYTTAGTYLVSLKVSGGGQTSTLAAQQTLTILPASSTGTNGNSGIPTIPGLVGAYGFDEAGGSSLTADASGQNNHGAILGATQTTGRFGNGLQFNGYSQQVSIKGSTSLNTVNFMTLESWVYPKASKGGRSVIFKENNTGFVYSLYSNASRNVPASSINIGNYRTVSANTSLPTYLWSHIASTYDGKYQRFYLNGREIANRAQTGQVLTSDGALKIGGNAIWSEWFTGIIDEVRVYNRALTASEIIKDMTQSVITTNPPQSLLGENNPGATLTPLPMGTAKAVQTTAMKASLLNRLSIYLDASSQSSPLILGLYSDNQGHPANRLAVVRLSAPIPGQWNAVPVNGINLTVGEKYWLVVLNPLSAVNPIINLRANTLSSTVELSGNKGLTDLPAIWTNGIPSTDGIWAEQGMGY